MNFRNLSQYLGLILGGLTLSACAGADYPGFVDAAVEVTTGVELQEDLEYYLEQQAANEGSSRNSAEPQAVVRTAAPTSQARATSRERRENTSAFANWSAIVVAGDFHASSGADTEAFDNARRDFASQLTRIGFERENIAQFSMRPERYTNSSLQATNFSAMERSMRQMRRNADEGCLVFMTSHGFPSAFAVGVNEVIVPSQINGMLDELCGEDPTILVVSACYSGIFAQGDMTKENRFIMTASRSDRTSFGCGEGERYPYFDACILETFPRATNWVDIARGTRSCVEAREQAVGLAPPSSPQIYMGPEVRDVMMAPFVFQSSDDYGPPVPGT